MEPLNIEVIVEGVEWGRANYVRFNKETKHKAYITLYEFSQDKELKLKENAALEFKIFLKNRYYTDFELLILEQVTFLDEKTVVFHTSSGPNQRMYDQDIIDLFKSWNDGKKTDWRSLTKIKDKKKYLVTCLYWSGLPKRINEGEQYIIDGAQVKHEIDFYCLLGEVFFGERGYFGQDIDGLEDCLCCEIKFFEPKKNNFLIIMSSARLEKVLNKGFEKYGNNKSYLSILIEIFEKYGFIVDLR